MTGDQNHNIIQRIKEDIGHLRDIEAGKHPYDLGDIPELEGRRMFADWQLRYVLQDLVEMLPRDVRNEVQTCLEINEHIWSKEYRGAYYASQQREKLLREAMKLMTSKEDERVREP